MSIFYLVTKKVFPMLGEKSEQWFAVQRKLQKKGGATNRELADRLSEYTSFNRGDIQGILTELPNVMAQLLQEGRSVTIDGLGTFQTALTSDGFDHPEEITPGKVRLSRVYFRADKKLMEVVKKARFIRIPLSQYLPKSLLSKKVIEEEAMEEEIG